MECKVLDFHMKDTWLHDVVYSNPKSLSVDEIIRKLKTKFRSLKSQGLWSPSKIRKLETEGDLESLKLAMKKLAESKKRG